MRKKAEKSGPDLTAAEKEIDADVDNHKAEMSAAPEYNADCSDLGLSGNFTNKASGKTTVSRKTSPPPKPQAYTP